MYVIEPKQVQEPKPGWQMVCRSMGAGRESLAVTPVYPTVEAARRDRCGKKWQAFIQARGELGLQLLRWAHKRIEAKPGLEMGTPKEVEESYLELKKKPEKKSRKRE